jgi:cobalt transport protein ATP-binding subunit
MTADIVIEGLSWKYKGQTDWALNDINLQFKKGEFICITGPSGAGKSTLSMCMNGLIPQRSQGEMKGTVLVKGMNTRTEKLFNIVEKVGLVFQDPETQFVTMTVEDEIAYPLENFGFPREEMTERIKWASKTVRMQDSLDKYPFELSGGQKQRVCIASVLALKPDVFILDEPTSDLDPIGKAEVFSVIADLKNKFNTTMIVVEHFSEEMVKYADRVLLLYGGQIIRDEPPNEFFQDVEFLREKGVYSPQVTEFAYELRKMSDIDYKSPVILEEAAQKFSDKFRYLAGASTHIPSVRTERTETNTGEEIISVKGLHYAYPDGTVALRGVDLSINRGEYVAIIGQNGSGKTTFVKHFNGLLKPTQGTVEVSGKETSKWESLQLTSKVAYVYQNPDHQLFCPTVYDECAYGPRNLGLTQDEVDKRVQEALEAVDLQDFVKTPTFLLGKGQRQRLSVASVLTMKPEVIIVDEPTTGQDMRQSEGIMKLVDSLNRAGRTVVIITHNMRIVAEHARRTIVMMDGKITMDGSTSEVFSNPKACAETFLCPPQITQLAQLLQVYGFSPGILTVGEMVNTFNQLKNLRKRPAAKT